MTCPEGVSVEIETSLGDGNVATRSKVLFQTCNGDKYVISSASLSG